MRKILHLDLDAFFCAVEELHNPGLRGKAFAVGGRPEQRGVVASCSYAARQYGVHSAMPMARAVRQCPGLVIVPGRHGLYSQASHQVMERLHDLSGLVEQVSIDEAYLDLSELAESGEEIARLVQNRIWSELELPCSLGVASNKLVAKIANDVGKAARRGAEPPRAITVVEPGREAEFLAPLKVEALHGIGPKTAARLAELGIHTIGELARAPHRDLSARFGKYGAEMALRAQGLDDRPVITEHETKSISQEVTFSKDVHDEDVLHKTLAEQAGSLSRQLRQEGLCCWTVRVKLRWPDFTTLTRQLTLPQPTDQENRLFEAGLFLLHKVWQPGKPIRLLGLGASGLGPPAGQLELWDEF